MKQLLLKIAEFNVLIRFHQREKNSLSTLENMIVTQYKPYTAYQNFQKPHFTIEIVDENITSLDFVRDNTKNLIETYGNFYERKTLTKIMTFHHISLEQFHYLLLHIIERLLFKHNGFLIQGSIIFVEKKAKLLLNLDQSNDRLFIIRKLRKSFFCYLSPQLVFTQTETLFDYKINLDEVYLSTKNIKLLIKEIKNKDLLISQLLRLSNVSAMEKIVEYKQYATGTMKVLFDFINTSKFYLISSDLRLDQLNQYKSKNKI